MFWTGPFTDKPYMALLSYLYTQNLGLHTNGTGPPKSLACRPTFVVWVNDSSPNITAVLADNPWSAPFVHPRFKDVIEIRRWDTTEQLDAIPELRDDWRKYKDVLLNSGGHVIKPKAGEKVSCFDKDPQDTDCAADRRR
jgi:WD repeat and SOF domain-containing protein 1